MPRKRRRPTPDQTACVIYARFSSDRQRDESIEDQVAVCSKWAAARGLAVVSVYADRAISGTSDERPQFLRMVADAEREAFSAVVVYKLDRFSRDRYDTATYKKKLQDLGVRVESAMESIPDSPEGLLLESLISGMNEYYVRNLAQNVRRGMMGNAERCLTNGNVVYGYKTGADGRYEVDERQAANVRRAFELAGAGKTRKEVMAWLNDSGVRNARGRRWTYDNVRHLLSNERYLGVYLWGDVRVDGGMPAIVTRAQFDAAQTGTPAGKPRQNSFPLSGKLYDYESGTPYRGTSGTSCNGRQYLYYSVPDGEGHERRYPKDVVESAVVEVLDAAFQEPEYAESMADMVMAVIGESFGGGAVAEMRRELADVEKRQEAILDAVEAGMAARGLVERSNALDAQKKFLEERLERSQLMPDRDEVAAWIREHLCEQSGYEIMGNAVQRCAIDADGKLYVEVPWRLGSDMLESAPNEAMKKGEPAGRCEFAQMVFGSPYQIRTGDLRLERAAS